eukprot:353299-Chlamydomonas_euryale.AAC.11
MWPISALPLAGWKRQANGMPPCACMRPETVTSCGMAACACACFHAWSSPQRFVPAPVAQLPQEYGIHGPLKGSHDRQVARASLVLTSALATAPRIFSCSLDSTRPILRAVLPYFAQLYCMSFVVYSSRCVVLSTISLHSKLTTTCQSYAKRPDSQPENLVIETHVTTSLLLDQCCCFSTIHHSCSTHRVSTKGAILVQALVAGPTLVLNSPMVEGPVAQFKQGSAYSARHLQLLPCRAFLPNLQVALTETGLIKTRLDIVSTCGFHIVPTSGCVTYLRAHKRASEHGSGQVLAATIDSIHHGGLKVTGKHCRKVVARRHDVVDGTWLAVHKCNLPCWVDASVRVSCGLGTSGRRAKCVWRCIAAVAGRVWVVGVRRRSVGAARDAVEGQASLLVQLEQACAQLTIKWVALHQLTKCGTESNSDGLHHLLIGRQQLLGISTHIW